MGTFLFDSIIFGPVRSRRLGVSLGINLLPPDGKICSFDCVYCECGWTDSMNTDNLPSAQAVAQSLESKLKSMHSNGEPLDVITFAGNGEPTLHPQFAEIIDNTVTIRNELFPSARIAVLSNATMLHRADVFNALLRVDDNIQKLDSVSETTINLMNKPLFAFNLEKVIDQLKRFHGNVTIQTLFVKGQVKGKPLDNTSSEEVGNWLEVIAEIKPKEVMVYTIARDTPLHSLTRIDREQLELIAEKVSRLGIAVQVSA